MNRILTKNNIHLTSHMAPAQPKKLKKKIMAPTTIMNLALLVMREDGSITLENESTLGI